MSRNHTNLGRSRSNHRNDAKLHRGLAPRRNGPIRHNSDSGRNAGEPIRLSTGSNGQAPGANPNRSRPIRGRYPRREECLVCFGDAAVQHDDLDGAPDPQCFVVLCAVRARGHRRAHPRQDRRLKKEGDVDGRGPAARVSGARPQAGHRRQRGRTRALDLSPLCRTRLGAVVEGRVG